MAAVKPRFLVLVLLCGLSILIFACTGSPFARRTNFTPGVYLGYGSGYRGMIQVRVQTSAAGIEDAAIVSHQESNYPGLAAMLELMEQVLETGDTDLDAISGATYSSRGFLWAVEDALEKARRR
jgi:urocanate reductase